MNINVSKKMTGIGGLAGAILALISADKIDDVKSAIMWVAILGIAWVIMQGAVDVAKTWGGPKL